MRKLEGQAVSVWKTGGWYDLAPITPWNDMYFDWEINATRMEHEIVLGTEPEPKRH